MLTKGSEMMGFKGVVTIGVPFATFLATFYVDREVKIGRY
jgi:hypothetical protein